eukprot:GHVN01083793.1.p2 GENE.GHVN01083793.1~~GHVN01083793.1.p2  ORF type:complete len:386 (+),score=78.44 GHVN01083793.1:3922-5079(+)
MAETVKAAPQDVDVKLVPEEAKAATVDEKAENVLMISSRKPRGFYERAAKELFASGENVVKVSALGDAIALAVELANMLEQKKAAKIIKVETKYQLITRQYKSQSTSPGIQLVLEKDPEFKCSRIIPGYVSFCAKPEDGGFTPVYDEQPKDTFASLNAGSGTLSVGGDGINGAFAKILGDQQHDVPKYEEVHKKLLAKAIQASKDATEKDRTMLVESDEPHPDLKASYCRVCPKLKSGDGSTGAVFVDIFNDTKRPHMANNYAMIMVVAPNGSDYSSPEGFLSAVEETGVNLMTTFCDFNGMVKRSKSSAPLTLKRINVVRVCLFSGGEHKHKDATKSQVAHSILSGLSKGYHYGPSPRLNFAYDGDDVFKQVWVDMTGLPAGEM